MILYTIYDHNIVFKNGFYGEQQANTSYSEMNVDGTIVQVSQINKEDFHIERIISTNPSDYLNPKLQPGCVIQTFLDK